MWTTAGVVNAVGSDMRGVQISGVSNLLQSGNGVQVAMFNNVAGEEVGDSRECYLIDVLVDLVFRHADTTVADGECALICF